MIPRKPGAIGQQSLHSARSTKPGWTEVGSKRPNALASFIVRPTNTKRIYAALAEIVPGSLLRRSLGKDNDDNDDNGDDDDHGDHGDHEQGKKEKQLGEARSNDKGWNVSSSSPSSRESAAVECENKTGKATDDEADIIDDKDDSDGSDHSKDSETEDELNADAIEKHTSAVSKKASRPKAPGALYQLTLDLGAGFQAGKICPVCGVLLNPGSAEDEALHKVQHDRVVNGLPFPGWSHEDVVASCSKASTLSSSSSFSGLGSKTMRGGMRIHSSSFSSAAASSSSSLSFPFPTTTVSAKWDSFRIIRVALASHAPPPPRALDIIRMVSRELSGGLREYSVVAELDAAAPSEAFARANASTSATTSNSARRGARGVAGGGGGGGGGAQKRPWFEAEDAFQLVAAPIRAFARYGGSTSEQQGEEEEDEGRILAVEGRGEQGRNEEEEGKEKEKGERKDVLAGPGVSTSATSSSSPSRSSSVAVEDSERYSRSVRMEGRDSRGVEGSYLYVYVANSRVYGALLARRLTIIERNYRAVSAIHNSTGSSSGSTSTSSDNGRVEGVSCANLPASPAGPGPPPTLSTTSARHVTSLPRRYPSLGVDAIWVLPAARSAGVARAMLDAARTSVHYEAVVESEHVAFSEPTEAGARLARGYTGRSDFYTYAFVMSS